MIYREHYIEQVREFYDSDLIKVITGVRRSGKSVMLEQIMQEINKKTDNIIALNFEDKRVSSSITDADMDYSTGTVEHIKLKDFLLMKNLDK